MTETPDTFDDDGDGPDQDAIFDDPDETLDSGYSPPESYRGEGFGTTADEAQQGESLDERLRQEEPEPDPYAEVGEDLDEMLGPGQRHDLHHRGHRAYDVEDLLVRAADRVEVGDVGDVHPRTDDVLRLEPRGAERRERDAERHPGLLVGIAHPDDLAPDGRSGAGDPRAVADADGAGVAHDVLER